MHIDELIAIPNAFDLTKALMIITMVSFIVLIGLVVNESNKPRLMGVSGIVFCLSAIGMLSSQFAVDKPKQDAVITANEQKLQEYAFWEYGLELDVQIPRSWADPVTSYVPKADARIAEARSKSTSALYELRSTPLGDIVLLQNNEPVTPVRDAIEELEHQGSLWHAIQELRETGISQETLRWIIDGLRAESSGSSPDQGIEQQKPDSRPGDP